MRKQYGFSAIEGLLVIFVIVIIGFGGWYVLNQSRQNKESAINDNSLQEVVDNNPILYKKDSGNSCYWINGIISDSTDTVEQWGEPFKVGDEESFLKEAAENRECVIRVN